MQPQNTTETRISANQRQTVRLPGCYVDQAMLADRTKLKSTVRKWFMGLRKHPKIGFANGNLSVTLSDRLTEADVDALLIRARVMRRKGQDAGAELLLRLMQVAVPEHPKVNFRLGHYLFKPYPKEQAIPYLKVALEKGSGMCRTVAAVYLAIWHLLEGERSAAQDVLARGGVGEGRHLETVVEAVKDVRDRDYSGVIFCDEPPYPVAHITAASLLHLAGDDISAIACLGRVLRHGREAVRHGRWDIAFDADELLCSGGNHRLKVGCDMATGLLMCSLAKR